jgi:hypothetical protein
LFVKKGLELLHILKDSFYCILPFCSVEWLLALPFSQNLGGMLYRKIIFFYYIWQPTDSAEEPDLLFTDDRVR